MKTKIIALFFVLLSSLLANSGTVTFTNTTGLKITDLQFGFLGGGHESFTVVAGLGDVAPGQTISFSPTWYSGAEGGSDYIDYQFVRAGTGYAVVGNSFVTDGSGTIYVSYGSGGLGDGYTSHVDYGGGALVPVPTPDDKKSLWLVTDSTLTADLYREGVDKMVAATYLAAPTSTGGGSSADADWLNTKARTFYENQFSGSFTLPEIPGKAAALASAKTDINTAMGAKAAPSMGTAASATSSVFSIPLGHTGHTLNLDPASNATVTEFATWTKSALSWLVFTLFQMFLWNYFKDIYQTFSLSAPAKGNTVLLGTGGQATSFVLASAITAVVVTVPTLFWVLAESGVTWASGISNNPTESAAAGSSFIKAGLYLFNFFLPVNTLLSALTSYFIVTRGGLILLAGAQTVIRFLVF